jgi:hypothetical protein
LVTYIALVCGKSMVDSGGKNEEVVLFHSNAYPLVILTADIKVSSAVADVADLLIFMEVLIKECFDLLLIDVTHSLWGDCDLVSILVSPLNRKSIHSLHTIKPIVVDAELGKVVGPNRTARVVRKSGITLLQLVINDGILP